MSLQTNVSNLVTRLATEFKKVYAKQGDTASLSTTDKTSLVAALNELNTYARGIIVDASTGGTTTTLSAAKITQMIAAAKSEIIGGADSLHDTLKELQDFITSDEAGLAAFSTALGNRLRIDAAQNLTTAQKAQGVSNLGAVSAADVGDVTTDFVAAFNSALV